jgi:TRAP-type mannitol/chloroaromatic compound transport system permease large subunit
VTQPRDISHDPVRQQRARIAKLASTAQRIGYLLFGVAVVLFFAGFFAGFTNGVVTAIVIAMVIGSFLLAPAIVAGYAVKAAERDDLENGR